MKLRTSNFRDKLAIDDPAEAGTSLRLGSLTQHDTAGFQHQPLPTHFMQQLSLVHDAATKAVQCERITLLAGPLGLGVGVTFEA